MANFTHETFIRHDDYMTPLSAWDNIKHLIPRDKVIWEAFYGNGESGQMLSKLGFNVIHEPVDFFEHDLGDVVVSNPPFSKIREIMVRLKQLGKPFIMIMPSSKINTGYFRIWKEERIQIIIPSKRIHFDKLVNGVVSEKKSSCNFDCFYYTWKMNLPRDIVFL
jgi:hypothetical protein